MAVCLALSVVFFGLSGCQDLGLIDPDSTSINDPIIDYVEINDVPYGKGPLQKLDIALPLSLEKNPAEVVILIHGGGWTTGDKFYLGSTVNLLKKAKKNLAIVNVNYRIASDTGNLISLQREDISSAVAYLVENAGKYNIKDKDYMIAGISAGGHLALTHAYGDNKNQIIKTVVAASAPTELCIREMVDASLQPNVQYLVGAKYEGPLDAFIEASPFYLASFRSPRTILLYGEDDKLVSVQHGALLHKKLKALRVPHSYILYPGEAHNVSAEKITRNVFAAFQNQPAN
ncbi:alpha/beta hydrolase [Telluribacter sp. SYSU D00476]|uniref:alpha/beta hydrolase n=1 Tax=Telluribacter sp. SYSU D00476 TaxID=2811430 RepID=UPI001FF2D4B9|nr:alpha/beta hydrolase [Telluribacter sp. SYSU D00476]